MSAVAEGNERENLSRVEKVLHSKKAVASRGNMMTADYPDAVFRRTGERLTCNPNGCSTVGASCRDNWERCELPSKRNTTTEELLELSPAVT